MKLSEAARTVNGKFTGQDKIFIGISIDSRKTLKKNLFFAIRGKKFDGHNYIFQAKERGSIASMVSSESRNGEMQICVSDTTKALGQLASHWRSRFKIEIIAITGSNGKTSVTSMVANILNQNGGCCLSPQCNFNNQFGVPLTILGLGPEHRYAVIEMGMRHSGDINYLTSITKPTIALINNVAPAHSKFFKNIEDIAAAKAEIFNGLPESGVAILNLDDHFFDYWYKHLRGIEILTFSLTQSATAQVKNIQMHTFGSTFDLLLDNTVLDIHLSVPGKHNIMNAAAAATASFSSGIALSKIKRGLETFQSPKGRLSKNLGYNQSIIIDDTYNANPYSVEAAINVLASICVRKFLILGTMEELGSESYSRHYQIGCYARKKKLMSCIVYLLRITTSLSTIKKGTVNVQKCSQP